LGPNADKKLKIALYVNKREWPMKTNRQVSIFVLATTALFFAGCGGGKKTPMVTDQGAATPSSNLNPSCKKDNCPPAQMGYNVIGSGGEDKAELVFYKDEDNLVTIAGMDEAFTNRTVGVLLTNIPSGAKIDPTKDSGTVLTTVNITWSPDKAQKNKSSSPLKIYLRDMDKCLVEKNEKLCNAYEPTPYDKVISANWKVISRPDSGGGSGPGDSEVVTVSNPDCDGFKPTTNSDLMQTGLQTGIGILTGGGGAILDPALIGGLIGGISGGNSQPVPDDC